MSFINNINKSKIKKAIDDFSNSVLENDLVPEARQLVSIINEIFEKKAKEVKEHGLNNFYQKCLAKAKLVCFFDLEKKDILFLIENYIQLVLEIEDLNIINKMRFKLVDIIDFGERDELKEEVNNALFKNKHKITKNKIKTGGTLKEPTIANWLKDYFSKRSDDKDYKLQINEYLTSDENIKKLSRKEIESLKKLIEFFEFNKTSSEEIGNLDENFVFLTDDNKLKIVDKGIMYDIDPNIVRLRKKFANIESSASTTERDILDDNADQDFLVKKALQQDELENKNQEPDTSAREALELENKKDLDSKELKNYSITKLEKILPEFSSNSLEYKAIKQEINRLRSKKNKNERK